MPVSDELKPLLKYLAVHIAARTIESSVMRDMVHFRSDQFTRTFWELFEKRWKENGPTTILHTYRDLLDPERSLSRADMRHATDE